MNFVSGLIHSLDTRLVILWQSLLRALLSIVLYVGQVLLILVHTVFLWWKVLYVDPCRLFIDVEIVSKAPFSLHTVRGWPFNCISGIFFLIVMFLNVFINCGGHQFIVNLISTIAWGCTVSFLWEISDGIQNHIWLHWRQRFNEFLEADFCISIQIDSSHDCDKFSLDWTVSDFLKKSSNRYFINVSEIRGVNSLESSSNAKLLEFLEILLQLFEFQLEVNFLSE